MKFLWIIVFCRGIATQNIVFCRHFWYDFLEIPLRKSWFSLYFTEYENYIYSISLGITPRVVLRVWSTRSPLERIWSSREGSTLSRLALRDPPPADAGRTSARIFFSDPWEVSYSRESRGCELRGIFPLLSVTRILLSSEKHPENCRKSQRWIWWSIPSRKITPHETPRGMMIYEFSNTCFRVWWILSRMGYESRKSILEIL